MMLMFFFFSFFVRDADSDQEHVSLSSSSTVKDEYVSSFFSDPSELVNVILVPE